MLYAEIFQQSIDAIFVVDAATTLTLDCNLRAVELFEAEYKAQLLNIAGHSLQKTPFTPHERQAIKNIIDTQGTWEQELEYLTLQGRLFWAHLVVKQVQANDQRINVAWVTDISDRKAAELLLADYNQQLTHEITQQCIVLQTRETEFQTIFANSPIGIAVVKPPHYTLGLVNPAFTQLLGYSSDELATLSLWDITVPEDCDNEAVLMQDCLQGNRNTYHLEKRYRRNDGTSIWVSVNTAMVRDDQAQLQFGMIMIKDITARKLAEQALETSEARYRLLAENMTDLVCLHQPTGEYLYVSPSSMTLLGYASDDLIGRNPYDFFHPDDREQIRQNAHYNALCQTPTPIIYRMRHADGQYIWLETLTIPILDEAGQVVRLQTTSRDVSDRVQVQLQLEHDSVHDILTGLPNRVLLIERLELALNRAKRYPDMSFAVLFVDLDRFKVINDSLGHLAGDRVLKWVAQKLRQLIRETDLVGRISGDEFVILLEAIEGIHEVLRVTERILNDMATPLLMDDREVFVTLSIGVVINCATHYQAADILRDADIAMYRAKLNGKARYEIFDPMMRLEALKRLHLENGLRQALEHHAFVLYYQPIVHLTRQDIVGAEVLVRWQHPQRGVINPAEFIPIAEETGLIVPLGLWVLRYACQQMVEWQHTFPAMADFRISVNLSARQLREPNLVKHITEILAKTGLPGHNLVLELTESMLAADEEAVVALLSELRSHAIEISIDDFGTGYSSLSYLHRFPINTLKIDRSFVMGMQGNEAENAIASIILALAQQLKLSVVAEGIETETQLQQLQQLGCSKGQGYLFAPPLTADEITARFEAQYTPVAPSQRQATDHGSIPDVNAAR